MNDQDWRTSGAIQFFEGDLGAGSALIYGASVQSLPAGGWKWQANIEDEWNFPLDSASGECATENAAKESAEQWLRSVLSNL